MPTISGLPTQSGPVPADAVIAVDLPDGTTVQYTAAEFAALVPGGGVSSVGLSMPAEFSVAGSPVTSSGTLAVTKATQAASQVFAGPSSGGAAAPTFRPLVWNSDLPLYSTLGSTSGLDGDEHIAVEKGGTFIQTTTLFLSRLLTSFVNIFTKNQSVMPVGLTDGATINTDASLSNSFKVTIAGNRTLANPTNLTDGMVLNWVIRQDGTGTRTLAYGSKFKWVGGTAPVVTATAGAVSFISAFYDAGNDILIASSLLGVS